MTAFGPAGHAVERPPAVEAKRLVTEWNLSTEHTLQIHVRGGDALHIVHGTVWLSVDAPLDPIALCEGASYAAARDAVLYMFGADDPRVAVHSGSPVTVRARADYGVWRHRPLIAGP